MQLKITIADDQELRNFIKDSIKGVITEIIRQDAKAMVEDYVNTKLEKVVEACAGRLARVAVSDAMYQDRLQVCVRDALRTVINKEAIAYMRREILIDFHNLVEGKRDGV